MSRNMTQVQIDAVSKAKKAGLSYQKALEIASLTEDDVLQAFQLRKNDYTRAKKEYDAFVAAFDGSPNL